jgi:hypothetical protein
LTEPHGASRFSSLFLFELVNRNRNSILNFGELLAMTHRYWATLLIVTVLGACLPALAQDLVSPKLLPPAPELRAGITARNIALDMGTDPPSQPAAPHRHWSKTGKILTIVGASLAGAGAVALAHGETTQVACTSNGSGGTCVDIAWRTTGAIWLGAGAALVIVGVTRHTDD